MLGGSKRGATFSNSPKGSLCEQWEDRLLAQISLQMDMQVGPQYHTNEHQDGPLTWMNRLWCPILQNRKQIVLQLMLLWHDAEIEIKQLYLAKNTMIFCDVTQTKVVRFEKKNYQCIKKTSLEGRINVSISTHHKLFISLFIFCLQESYECCEKKIGRA